MRSAVETLVEYAECDGTEWGETILALANLWRYYDYLSEDLQKALDKEIADQLEYIKQNCRIVEEEETFTRTVKTIEWNN